MFNDMKVHRHYYLFARLLLVIHDHALVRLDVGPFHLHAIA